MLGIIIHNDGTGDERIGNYDYKVLVNRNVIASGRIEGYERSWGWKGLVYAMLAREKGGKIDADN